MGAPKTSPRVVAILASGHPAFLRAEEEMRHEMLAGFPRARFVTVNLDEAGGEGKAREALALGPELVIAIGSRAAKLAREIAPDIPLVYAMVLDPAALGLPAPGRAAAVPATGVTMDVTPERQFELLLEIAPSARRIGVLYNPSISGDAVRRAAEAASARGLELVRQPVRTEAEVASAAALLGPTVDAFWALADPMVLTSANARAFILLSLRSGKPLFAMSEGLVRSGAMAGLSADPAEVGRRAGEMARRVLQGEAVGRVPPESPRRLAIFVNRASAAHLGLDLPADILARATTVYPRP